MRLNDTLRRPRLLWIAAAIVALVAVAMLAPEQWAADLGRWAAGQDAARQSQAETAKWTARDREAYNADRRKDYCAETGCDPR